MDLLIPIVVMAAIAVAAVVAYVRSDTGSQARRMVARERNVPIVSVEQGARVKVTGVVSAIEPLMDSPIDRQPCIGFRLVTIGLYGRGDNQPGDGTARRETVETSACARFAIEDDTGTAYIEGPFLVGLDLDGEWSVPITQFSHEVVQRFQLSGAWAFVYREGRLTAGDRVSVVGRASMEVDPAGARVGDRSPPVLTILRGSTDEPVIVADAARR